MGEAQQDLAKGNAREGSGKARDAADRLAKLRDSLQDGQRGQNGRNRREPVRIPGADESKAPREWRQELMEAMREKAPEPLQRGGAQVLRGAGQVRRQPAHARPAALVLALALAALPATGQSPFEPAAPIRCPPGAVQHAAR